MANLFQSDRRNEIPILIAECLPLPLLAPVVKELCGEYQRCVCWHCRFTSFEGLADRVRKQSAVERKVAAQASHIMEIFHAAVR